ncbi:MAG: hypothetical protein K2I35_01970, partial [Duncaniella sp.]|nr:hypothetical protein [Duncaniella sp.]
MNRKQQVLLRLKPKVKAFGFNKKELMGVAAKIADNLKSEEDASDEDVNAEIDAAIEAVIPILEVGRSYANRVINDSKQGNDENEENEEEDDDVSSAKSHKSTKTKQKKSDEEPEWFKTYRESMEKKFADLQGERIAA